MDPERWNTALPVLAPGAQLGPYRIDGRLGAGGMGEVYRARDTRLGRAVAIKVLPRDRLSDPDRRRRFAQEARAASALNHPHIITIYDIAQAGPLDYLVMELVAGQSLDRLGRGASLPLAQVRAYAEQLTSALAAAHAAGIVHRDIKPANVMVTDDGRVKVLDFGLAKLAASCGAADSAVETREVVPTEAGRVMGTLAYMSPEQARGEPLDARTDLFSLGAVIYELVTGRQAFERAFDWTAPPMDDVDPGLGRVVAKLLHADRELRYQTAVDVLVDLQRLDRRQIADEQHSRQRRWLPVAAATAVALVTIGALGVALWPRAGVTSADWVRLTNFPDSVSQPAVSPDGRMLAFIRSIDTFAAPGEIYVKMLPDGEPVQLTRDGLWKMSPVFSPDGSRIAYTVVEDTAWDTWVVQVLNPQPRRWIANASGLVWIDKQRLLYSAVKHDIHMAIVTSDENGRSARDVYVPSSTRGMAHRAAVSPDGRWAIVVEMDRGQWLPCRLVSIDGSARDRQIGPPNGRCTFAGWSPDGRWMYLSASAAGTFHVWRQRFPEGRPEQLTQAPTTEEGLAVLNDGSIVTAVGLNQSVVWLHGPDGERQISLEGYSYDPLFTPDGNQLLYRILNGAVPGFDSSELRSVDLASGQADVVLPGIAVAGLPGSAYDISPDGRQVVAAGVEADGRRRLWLTSLDGGTPPRMIPDLEGDYPHFGPLGDIFYRHFDGTLAFLYRVEPDGTGRRKISDMAIAGPKAVSSDGQWVLTRVADERGPTMTALSVEGKAPVRLGAHNIVIDYHARWGRDALFLGVNSTSLSSGIVGRTYVVPLAPGRVFPDLPAEGFRSAAEIAAIPGVRVIESFDAVPGRTPDVYAYSRPAAQRNLYRIPVR